MISSRGRAGIDNLWREIARPRSRARLYGVKLSELSTLGSGCSKYTPICPSPGLSRLDREYSSRLNSFLSSLDFSSTPPTFHDFPSFPPVHPIRSRMQTRATNRRVFESYKGGRWIFENWPKHTGQGVRIANLVRVLIMGIEIVCDSMKPKYAINRTILVRNFHKQLILRMYLQRKVMKHP